MAENLKTQIQYDENGNITGSCTVLKAPEDAARPKKPNHPRTIEIPFDEDWHGKKVDLVTKKLKPIKDDGAAGLLEPCPDSPADRKENDDKNL